MSKEERLKYMDDNLDEIINSGILFGKKLNKNQIDRLKTERERRMKEKIKTEDLLPDELKKDDFERVATDDFSKQDNTYSL